MDFLAVVRRALHLLLGLEAKKLGFVAESD
jgi:hypothetical protein